MTKVEYKYPVDAIAAKIFVIFDLFRSNHRLGFIEEQVHIVLLFLSLYKDGYITTNTVDSPSLLDAINIRNEDSATQYPSQTIYREVINILSHSLLKIDTHSFGYIRMKLYEIDRKLLINNFPQVFDNVLYRISQSKGRLAGEYIQPIEVSRFMCGLANLQKESKVYNPFSGLASFDIFIDIKHEYFGQELNKNTWALGVMRLMAFEKLSYSKYVCEDSILNWPEEFQKFDLIISNPPYGLRLTNQYREIERGTRTTAQFLVEKSIKSLSIEGKFIALLPQDYLSRGAQEQQLRQFLVDKDLLDTIISLPAGLLSNMGIPLIVLVINKKKEWPGKVRFIKADKFVESRNLRETVLNDSALNKFIQSSEEDKDTLAIVDNAIIQEWNYNLNVERYFQKEIVLANNERLIKLKDILEYFRGQRGNLPENGKLVRIRDLRDDNIDFNLSVSEIENSELRRPGATEIKENCLLLAIRWRTLKPTYFNFEGTSIYITQDVLSFKVDESIADYGFVINELSADYVLEQLETYRIGATIPFIRRDDLLEVAIKLPSLQEQKAKIKGIFELSNKIKILELERNALAHGVSTKLYESVSTIKHSLGSPLLNIGSSLRNIEKALSKLNFQWEHVKLNERYDLSIKDSFNSIYSNLELIHSMLLNNESFLDFSKYELFEIDFLAFIKMYMSKIKSAESSNVTTNLDIHPDIKIQLKNEVLVLANKDLLDIGLNAIVENAKMHAFTDHSKKYKLEFRVSLYVAPGNKKQPDDTLGRFDTYIKVEVANNGNRFPENYSLEKLIRKNSFAGDTGNTGQGGFDLNEIIKFHNKGVSTLELITNDLMTEFTSTYSFLIPFNR